MGYARAMDKMLALMLVAAVGSVGLPAMATPSTAILSGKVLRSAGGTPLAGAVVKASLRSDARIFESAKADAKGNYSLPSLPAGTYDVAIEADGGLYVVSGALALRPGERRAMSLSVRATADEPPPATPPSEGEDKSKEKQKPKEQPKGKGGGFFHSVWGGAILILGSAAVIGAVVSSSDNDEPATASPSD